MSTTPWLGVARARAVLDWFASAGPIFMRLDDWNSWSGRQLPVSIDSRWPQIWCPTCERIQPLQTDVMEGDARNSHAALDLLCASCLSIVATLHEGPKVRSTVFRFTPR